MQRKNQPVFGWLVGWWVSGLVVGLVHPAPANPPTKPEDALQARSRAVEYLRARQNGDGGFPLVAGDSDPEVTAWATLALWLAERPTRSEALQRGLSYLLKAQAADGSWDNNTAHTAFAAVTLTMVGGHEEAVQKAVQWLKAAQGEDGSWGREPGGPGLTIYTGVALTALGRAGRDANAAALRRGGEWLRARQAEGGGWPMAAPSPAPPSDSPLQAEGEGPPLTMATSWAILGGASAGADPSHAAVRRGLAWLQQRQTAAGGFAASDQSDQPDPELTAYALLALAVTRSAPEAVRRAVSYLVTAQQPDGGYVSGTPRELKEPAENLQTTSFVAISLAILQDLREAR